MIFVSVESMLSDERPLMRAYVSTGSSENSFLDAVFVGLLRLIVMAFGSNVPPETVTDGHVDFFVMSIDAYLATLQLTSVMFDVSTERFVLIVMP